MEKKLTENDELILVLNSGSSSLKFGVYRRGVSDEESLLTGRAEGVGKANGTFSIRAADGATLASRERVLESQEDALAMLASAIKEHVGGEPSAVGHRIVHGGPKLVTHQKITRHVLDELRAAVHFAPLHIPQALSLVASAQSIFSSATSFACFDDAFHRTLPEVASRLPLPQRFADRGIRRYGFHGLSYESLVHHFGEKLPARAVFAHLGNGASLCALRNGRSVDTTMGLTPTGGIPMGTRSGDLDPGVVLYLLRNGKLDADELEDMLNHKSGLFALSSGESDVRRWKRGSFRRTLPLCWPLIYFRLQCARQLAHTSRCWEESIFSSSPAESERTANTFGPVPVPDSTRLGSRERRFKWSPRRKKNRSLAIAGSCLRFSAHPSGAPGPRAPASIGSLQHPLENLSQRDVEHLGDAEGGF